MIPIEREGNERKFAIKPLDPARQLNRSDCKADFTYTMALDVLKIQDTGKGEKSVADDVKAVLRKIEYWHQGSIAGSRISYQDADGLEHDVEWNGHMPR